MLQLYVIGTTTRTCFKIGVGEHPRARLLQLQTGSAERLELIHSVPASRADEAHAHAIMRKSRIRSGAGAEWFDLGDHAADFRYMIRAAEMPIYAILDRLGRELPAFK